MKKTFFTGLIIFIIGGIMLAIGFGRGGVKSIYWDNGFQIDRKITQTRGIKNVDTIKLEGVNYGPVSIHQGDVAKVTVHANKSNSIKTRQNGKELTISGGSKTKFLFGDFGSNENAPTIEITVPKKTQIKTIENSGDMGLRIEDLKFQTLRSTGNGDLSLTNVSVSKRMDLPRQTYGDVSLDNATFERGLNLNSSGDITIRNSQFTKADSRLRSEDGDIDLSNNRWRNLNISSTNGDIDLEDQTVNKMLTADTDNGDLTARIIPHAGTTIQANSSNGDASIYGESHHNYGQPKAKGQTFQLSSSNGDVTVTR